MQGYRFALEPTPAKERGLWSHAGAQLAELDLPPMVVVIHYGRTEQDILGEMKAHGVKLQEVRQQ